MSPSASLATCILSLLVGWYLSQLRPKHYPAIILCLSLAWLWFTGPSASGFGLSIGSGWVLLNQAVDQLVPVD
ncbi:MAG: hypothetical protein CXX69_05790 [Candidatus Thalassarchaeum betae]|jgi:hypothetical protein|uniref:Uncharacterized protein n=1 Tax=Candidatus Thalassarchaeum betae TaxID=2599289 RepID=A0A2V3HPT3_9ARCH|nr:MAG: hypothetical protein CXX69_05790 [Candidatus Thalassoarchaea betae]PXF24852.1 MAG: hypothetical protein CXX70_09995 [Euryarchaeota archaeon]HIC50079.1 hypothetical protein [Candidatus Poseidoniales archaeon]HIM13663.1 hypothetical protein [Candidatus Poseidoniales archaeon]HIM92327.1 hypothetical protein [Candidatus Poseidoniales archaeon]